MIDRETLRIEARRFRTCPPPAIWKEAARASAMRDHLAVCPHCEREAMDPDGPETVWGDFLNDLRVSRPPDLFPDPPPARPGQFHPLRGEKAHWRGGRYFSPPLVFVLDSPESPADFVRAAMTYHEPGLAGPGDLILENRRTGRGTLFVETWNIVRVSREALAPAAGAADDETLAAVRAMEADPAVRPEWAPLTRPLKPGDPRRGFRRLEREVAEIFAAPVLVPHAGPAVLRLAYDTARAAREALAAAAPRTRFPDLAAGLENLLAAAMPRPTALLAADEPQPISHANMVVLREGRIADFRPVRVETSDPVPVGRKLGFSGRVLELPETGKSFGLLAGLLRRDRFQKPDTVKWNDAEGWFYLEFDDPPHPPGSLAIAVLWEGAG